jgi:hemoglobin-like flavoprotein
MLHAVAGLTHRMRQSLLPVQHRALANQVQLRALHLQMHGRITEVLKSVIHKAFALCIHTVHYLTLSYIIYVVQSLALSDLQIAIIYSDSLT